MGGGRGERELMWKLDDRARYLGTGVTGGCEMPAVGAGNQIQILC